MDLLRGPSRRAMILGRHGQFRFGVSTRMGVHISRDAHLLVQEFASGGPALKRKHLKFRNGNNLYWRQTG